MRKNIDRRYFITTVLNTCLYIQYVFQKPAKKRASFVRACPPPPSGPANTPAPEPTTPRTDDQPIDDFDDSTIPRALPPLRPVPREESVSAAPAAAMTTEPTIQQTTATSTEPTMHQGSTPTMQQTTATSSEPTLQQASTPTTEPTIQQEEATLTAADIADSVLNSIRPRPPLQELRVNERPPMPTTERRPSVGSSGTALTSRRDSASPVQTPRESPLPGRTPFRPMRPANSGNVNQLQYSVNVCIEQLREYNKNNNENKKAVAATNRRITELESTVTRVETKIDQLMLMFAQQGQSNIGANNGTAANAHTTGAYATVEEIAPHLRVPSETLTLTHRKSHGAGHFASLLLPVIFPELFGPMRTRLNYNWDGCRAKNPLDAEKKSVLKTYTNMYYPESRTESSWAACVSKINECLRRKYVPKGKQLQGVVHDNDEQVMDCATGDFGEIPTFANDMINNSISDIPTPTFVEGFSNYTNFLNNV